MNKLEKVRQENLKEDFTDFSVGDTVQVAVKISEGTVNRVQNFSGVVIAMKGTGIAKTFTVRRVTFGQGVERVFPVHSPRIQSVVIEKKGRVRRSKLYYLREKVGKEAKIREKDSK